MEANQTNKGTATMTTVSPVTQIEELSKRLERAREIVSEERVSPVVGKDEQYVVRSRTAPRYRGLVAASAVSFPNSA